MIYPKSTLKQSPRFARVGTTRRLLCWLVRATSVSAPLDQALVLKANGAAIYPAPSPKTNIPAQIAVPVLVGAVMRGQGCCLQ
ncbi:MAG: hypothetical protein DMG97_26555 [Acidobacteria bacterium]|nr:MAG: hypothetical protein DMG97_26555 [Acidobacteriota bacterium]PYV72736.1 MAG: hypothetical protein DMG96_25210 [Acidobacteriota bacterium]